MDGRCSMPVLLVGHDVRCTRLLARMLRQDGFDMEVAIDGAAAIARLGRSPHPGALVTDMGLLHAGGIAVARYGRSLDESLPVILLTIDAHEAARVATRLDPRPTVLTKPLDYVALSSELHHLVGTTAHPPPAVA